MKKYIALLKNYFKIQLEHRFNNVVWFFSGLIPAFINLAVWKAVYNDQEIINGFRREDLLPYFLIIAVLWYIIGGPVDVYLGNAIKNGDINKDLIKPMHPILKTTLMGQGWKLGNLIILSPLIVLLVLIFKVHIPDLAFPGWVFLIIALINGTLIYAFWDLVIGMGAFFIQNVEPLSRFNRIICMLFSGQFVPLALMPFWITKINNLFLFRYTFSFPSEIIFRLDKINIGNMFLVQFFWVIFMILLFKLVYKIGIKRYEANGA